MFRGKDRGFEVARPRMIPRLSGLIDSGLHRGRLHKTRRCPGVTYLESYITRHTTFSLSLSLALSLSLSLDRSLHTLQPPPLLPSEGGTTRTVVKAFAYNLRPGSSLDCSYMCHTRSTAALQPRLYPRCKSDLQGYLAHKKQHPPLGPPQGPRHEPASASRPWYTPASTGVPRS